MYIREKVFVLGAHKYIDTKSTRALKTHTPWKVRVDVTPRINARKRSGSESIPAPLIRSIRAAMHTEEFRCVCVAPPNNHGTLNMV